MGSKKFEGVRFSAYPMDHLPMHVHGFYGETEAIVELLPEAGAVRLMRRKDAVRPKKRKNPDVRRILGVAKKNLNALMQLWEEAR